MEDTLGGVGKSNCCGSRPCVLILVLMEDTLGVEVLILQCILTMSLNPCSNGRYSRSVLTLLLRKVQLS